MIAQKHLPQASAFAQAPIELLVSLDENYLMPLRVMLTSLFQNNPSETISIWLLHTHIAQEQLDALAQFCQHFGATLHPIVVEEQLLKGAPTVRYYTKEMYYRLLAPYLLPKELSRVLYLDPDTLVINPLRELWGMDLDGMLFAAAPHTGKTEFSNEINKVRLGTDHDYYNSGVLLIDLEQGRREIDVSHVFTFATAHMKELILPDQDLLNSLYGKRTRPLDDARWNYDARKYNNYFVRSGGVCNVPWVMEHTAILHFCGSAKPWKPKYAHRFGMLYQHYMSLMKRSAAQLHEA